MTVENPTSEGYTITFVTPNDEGENDTWESDSIAADASANSVRWAIDDYFWNYWGSGITVTRVMYDVDAVETEDSSLATTYVYTVTLLRRIDTVSYTMALSIGGGDSTITIGNQVQGTGPISGAFLINCPDWDGNDHYTNEINYDHWVQGIENNLNNEIPHLMFRTYAAYDYDADGYRQNEISFLVGFDYEGGMPQCVIESGVNSPLTGTNLAYDNTEVQTYGENIVYNHIPLEMLTTQAQSPQV